MDESPKSITKSKTTNGEDIFQALSEVYGEDKTRTAIKTFPINIQKRTRDLFDFLKTNYEYVMNVPCIKIFA